MNEQTMRRREFLLGTAKASLTIVALGSVPALGADGARSAPLSKITLTEPPDIHYSLNILAAYLVQYKPPTKALPAAGNWTAVFDDLQWEGSPNYRANYYRKNRAMGELTLTRQADGSEARYDVASAFTLSGGHEDRIEASLRCASAPLLPIRKWKSRFWTEKQGKEVEMSVLCEEGECGAGRIEIKGAGGKRVIELSDPLVCQWTLFDAIRSLDPAPDALPSFGMLQDLASFRPAQCISHYGQLQLELGGVDRNLRGFVQTGTGLQPAHYWIDENNNPLLVTYGMRALALKEIMV